MPAATTPQTGKGSQLGYSTATGAGPYTYTNLGFVTNFKPKYSTGETEVKLLSTGWLGYLATTSEGELDFTILHIPGDPGTQALQSAIFAGTVLHWQVKHPDGISSVAFDAFIKSYEPNYENDAVMTADVNLRLNTQPAFATTATT